MAYKVWTKNIFDNKELKQFVIDWQHKWDKVNLGLCSIFQ